MLNTAFPLPGIETVNSLVSEENLTPDWKKKKNIWSSPWCEYCWNDCNATSPNEWPDLTLELPRLPNIENLCWKILFNKPYLARVPIKRYHLNGNIMGFSTRIEKIEPHTEWIAFVKVLPKRFYLSGHTIGFRSQTQKLDPRLHYISSELLVR